MTPAQGQPAEAHPRPSGAAALHQRLPSLTVVPEHGGGKAAPTRNALGTFLGGEIISVRSGQTLLSVQQPHRQKFLSVATQSTPEWSLRHKRSPRKNADELTFTGMTEAGTLCDLGGLPVGGSSPGVVAPPDHSRGLVRTAPWEGLTQSQERFRGHLPDLLGVGLAQRHQHLDALRGLRGDGGGQQRALTRMSGPRETASQSRWGTPSPAVQLGARGPGLVPGAPGGCSGIRWKDGAEGGRGRVGGSLLGGGCGLPTDPGVWRWGEPGGIRGGPCGQPAGSWRGPGTGLGVLGGAGAGRSCGGGGSGSKPHAPTEVRGAGHGDKLGFYSREKAGLTTQGRWCQGPAGGVAGSWVTCRRGRQGLCGGPRAENLRLCGLGPVAGVGEGLHHPGCHGLRRGARGLGPGRVRTEP